MNYEHNKSSDVMKVLTCQLTTIIYKRKKTKIEEKHKIINKNFSNCINNKR